MKRVAIESPPARNKVFLKYEVQYINQIYKCGDNDLDSRSHSDIQDKSGKEALQFENYKTSSDNMRSVLIEPLTPNPNTENSKNKQSGFPLYFQSPNKNVEIRQQNTLGKDEYLQDYQWGKRYKEQKTPNQRSRNGNDQIQAKRVYLNSKKANICQPQDQKNEVLLEKQENQQMGIGYDNDGNGQNKKYKKGLASISLKVKNIVLQKGQLTYKQVSDLVLESSQQELYRLSKEDRQKEEKNIRRRVYDALNVLVSVDILGKHKDKRHVIKNQWTNFQGKKLTVQWKKIRQQEEQIAKRQKFCQQKEANLRNIRFKYEQIIALRKRNKERIQQQKMKGEQTNDHFGIKIKFPFIAIPKIHNLQVEINRQDDKSETIVLRGKNLSIIADLDVITKMRFDDGSPENKKTTERKNKKQNKTNIESSNTVKQILQ